MKKLLEKIKAEALKALENYDKMEELESFRVKYIGKKGEIKGVLKRLGSVAADERKEVGALANEIRAYIEKGLAEKKAAMQEKVLQEKLKKEVIDVTMPGKKSSIGGAHPVSYTHLAKLFCRFRFR